MVMYTGRRLLYLVPILVIVSFIIFSILLLLPGDPAFALLGEFASKAQIAEIRAKLQLDRPIVIQYLAWLGNFLSGDFGRSLRTRELVSEMLASRIPVTLELAFLSISLACVIGIPAGVAAALRRNTWVDVVASMISMGGVAMPFFWRAFS
jgi:peptide/nickel transport system permease protein